MGTELQPLARSDLSVGKPLTFPVYDRKGTLLLAAGQAVQSDAQLRALCMLGLYRNPRRGGTVVVDRGVRESFGTAETTGGEETVVSTWRSVVAATEDALGTQTLKMTSEGGTEHTVRLLGVNPDTSLIVSAPAEDGRLIFVKEGQVFQFKGLFGQSVVTFSASIIKVQFAPYPYLHLSWPDAAKVSSRTIRSARRARCKLPAVLYFASGERERQENCIVSDLSVGGAELTFHDDLPHSVKAGRLAFKIQVDSERMLVEAQIRVIRRKAERREADGVHYGIAFDDLAESSRIAIHAYILELLVSQFERPIGR